MSERELYPLLVDGLGHHIKPEPRQEGQPHDQVQYRLFSDRKRFLRRCQGCASWWRFRKSWIVGYSLITGKRLWRALPRYDCVVCGREVQTDGD